MTEPIQKGQELVVWSRIKNEIAQCKDIVVMGQMNYSLEAIQKWAKQSRQSLEAQNEIAEYRLRLNRKQGEWIEANIPKEGAQGLIQEHLQAAENSHLKLEDAGIDRNDSPKFRTLAQIPEDEFTAYIATSKKNATEITTSDACRLLGKAHVSYATGENEWYTPAIYAEAARIVMGGIDIDPASTKIGNATIKATLYFDILADGRVQKWPGNVWLNPPYSQPLVAEFCNLLVAKIKSGEVKQACVLVNNATETVPYQNMMEVCQAICFIKGRVKFVNRDGGIGAPLQGQTILYFGGNTELFGEFFKMFGVVMYAK